MYIYVTVNTLITYAITIALISGICGAFVGAVLYAIFIK